MPDTSFVDTINEIGLRHVVIDGIAALDGSRELSADRRRFVFETLARMFEDASIGALAGIDPHQYVRRAKPSSYDSFTRLSQLTTSPGTPAFDHLKSVF